MQPLYPWKHSGQILFLPDDESEQISVKIYDKEKRIIKGKLQKKNEAFSGKRNLSKHLLASSFVGQNVAAILCINFSKNMLDFT